uniref:Sulfatase domain-containing protein n=1 Tax=Rhabditophanes sp. KR3021 TaxID=114890 RepID=A0AC35UCU4_9BILA
MLRGPSALIKRIRPGCEVYDVKCFEKGATVFYDKFLKFKQKSEFTKPQNPFGHIQPKLEPMKNKYNVYIITVDSISTFAAFRGFNQTINYLKKQHNGVFFKNVNKVSENSLPNALAFLVGKKAVDVQDIEFNRPTIPNDFDNNPTNTYLDKKGFINFIYEYRKYVTLSSEDAKTNVFYKESSVGMKRKVAHHTSQPFQFMNGPKSFSHDGIYHNQYDNKCDWTHKTHLNYLKNYINSYSNIPKFGHVWLSRISHLRFEGHNMFDTFFEEYFRSIQKEMDNSFVFFMSDHGFRVGNHYCKRCVGDFVTSVKGDYENKNPFLVMTIPKPLRGYQMMNNLRENSHKHLSHFDTYATLLDIVTEADRTNYKNLSTFDFSSIVGSKYSGESLFRPINETERDCYSMGISFQYCLKTMPFIILKNISSHSRTILHKAIIDEVNKKMVQAKLKSECDILIPKYSRHPKIEYVVTKNQKLYWKISAHAVQGNYLFQAYFDSNLTYIKDTMLRMDVMLGTDYCVQKSPSKVYCHCKMSKDQWLRANNIG